MKKLVVVMLCVCMLAGIICAFTGCGEKYDFTIGLCNYVDDASLNQIVANIKSEIADIAKENNLKIKIIDKNCNADSQVLNQIIDGFIADRVDMMIGVATPVAMAMQAKTEDNNIPVVFAAVSDPIGASIVNSKETPGGNITGTSDYLDTNAVMELMFALNPTLDKVGLLYDNGQDSSTGAIRAAKAYLENKGITYVEKTGTNVTEIVQAVDNLITENVQCIFTPSDNTVMTAELSIYEKLADNGIQHYAGADSFALNGAFVGYGVDYANLGKETGAMACDILINKKDISTYAFKTFDNGIATINTEICTALGLDLEDVKAAFEGKCTDIKEITTAEYFE